MLSPANRYQEPRAASACTPTGTPCAAAAPLLSPTSVCSLEKCLLKVLLPCFWQQQSCAMQSAPPWAAEGPLLCPDARTCHRDVPRGFHPGRRWQMPPGGAGGCPASHHGHRTTAVGCRDALAVTMATPVHSQENKAARRETAEGKRKGRWGGRKKAGKALEERLGQGGALGRGNSGGGRWSCLQAALLGMTFSIATP